MLRPSITDYIDTLNNPFGVFRTLGNVVVERDVYGEPEFRAGNSAAIFTFPDDRGMRRFLKCYIRPNPHLRTVYDYVERSRSPLLPRARLLRDEVFVNRATGTAGFVDVIEGKWTEGDTLATALSQAAKKGDTARLSALSEAFDTLCRELLAAEWAHGDLKPENIIVRQARGISPNNEGKSEYPTRQGGMELGSNSLAICPVQPALSLTLIDCDAMWIPALAGEKATELGTPAYRHPGRCAAHFDKHIDDYPAMLISTVLRALSLAPELYAKYNGPDNLVLLPDEIIAGTSAAYTEILALFAREGMARRYRMAEALKTPFHECNGHAERFFTPEPVDPSASDGEMSSFVENGKWGFVDAAGNVAVEPFWDEVLEFCDGCAKVRLADKWHILCIENKKSVLKSCV